MNRISRVSISNDGRDLPLPMPLQKPGKVLPPKSKGGRPAAESTKPSKGVISLPSPSQALFRPFPTFSFSDLTDD